MEVGQLLLKRGLISRQQFETALAQSNGARIDQVLVEMDVLSEEDVLRALADDLGMRFVDLKEFTVDRELLAQFPTAAIFRHSLFPL